jgi:hypothetical protein
MDTGQMCRICPIPTMKTAPIAIHFNLSMFYYMYQDSLEKIELNYRVVLCVKESRGAESAVKMKKFIFTRNVFTKGNKSQSII